MRAASHAPQRVASRHMTSVKQFRVHLARRPHAVPSSMVGRPAWTAAGASYARPRPVQAQSDSSKQISGYTPAEFITYSADPAHACVHSVEAVVRAPAAECYAAFDDWRRLVDFLDLIGQIGLDDKSPDMALLQCYYRWAKLPVMEITFLLQKTAQRANERIEFASVWGMPLKGAVDFAPVEGDGGGAAATRVRLELTHPLPDLLARLNIGATDVETHVKGILLENLDVFKELLEPDGGGSNCKRPPGVLRAHAEATARRGAEQQQQRGGGASTSGSTSGGKAAAAAADADTEQEAGGKRRGASRRSTTAAGADAPASARGRSSASRRSTTAAGSNGAGPEPPPSQGSAGAAAGRPPRGRSRAASQAKG